MEDKKLYTVAVFTENRVGILNQISIIYTRRKLNIETLSVSPSSIEGVHKFTITASSDQPTIDKLVKQMIRDRQDKDGWDFLFLGANMDAIAVAEDMGIQADRAVTAMADAPGVSLQYDAIADANVSFRQTRERSASWKRRVEQDTASRGPRR